MAKETSIEGGRGVTASFGSAVEDASLRDLVWLSRLFRYQSLPREWTEGSKNGTCRLMCVDVFSNVSGLTGALCADILFRLSAVEMRIEKDLSICRD